MIVCSIFSNKQQYNSIQLCVISFEAQWRKTNERRRKNTTTLNKYMTMSTQHKQKTRARTNKYKHTHTQTREREWQREGERKKRNEKTEEWRLKKITHYILKAIFCCIELPHKNSQPTMLKAFFCDSSNWNRFSWFRSNVISFVRSFVHFSIFHVSTAPVNILWIHNWKKCTKKNIK